MTLRYCENCENIDWEKVPVILEKVDMGFTTPDIHKKAFEASYACIFAFDDDTLVGFGRILSDGYRQSAIYDIAIEPAYQGKGIGKEIVSRLVNKTPHCNFILYASPGKEGFYNTLNFKKMKTGMALFVNVERMIEGGFIEE